METKSEALAWAFQTDRGQIVGFGQTLERSEFGAENAAAFRYLLLDISQSHHSDRFATAFKT